MNFFEALFTLGLPVLLVIVIVYAVLSQRRALRQQSAAVAAQAHAIEQQTYAIHLAEQSLAAQQELLTLARGLLSQQPAARPDSVDADGSAPV